MIEPVKQPHVLYVPWLIAAAVVALAFGGIGGSVQISRVICILLMPFALLRLTSFAPKTKLQSAILIFAFLLIGLSAVSAVWSIDKATTFQYLFVIAINMLPLLMVGLLTQSEGQALRQLLPRAWLVAGSAVVPLALYELISGDHFALGFEERGGGEMVNLLPFASGVHGNYNDFSLFLVLCILGVCFGGVHQMPTGKWAKLFKYVAVALMSLVVVINSSRGAILCLLAIGFAGFLWPLRKRYLILLFLILPLVLGLAFGSTENDSLLLKYLQLKFTDFSGDLETDEGRLALIKAGLNGFWGSYGLGVGAGASSSYLATNPSIIIPNPHNVLLEWVLNFGISGFCLLLWFLSRLWLASSQSPGALARRLVRVVILILPLLGIIQSHLTGYTYFWLMLTTICAFAIGHADNAGGGEKYPQTTVPAH